MVRLNAETAARLGVNGTATVRTEHGSITLPVEHADLPDGVVWLPTNSGAVEGPARAAAGHGDVVTVTPRTCYRAQEASEPWTGLHYLPTTRSG